MNTLVAAQLLREQGFHANLTVLDADHSKEGVYRDLKNVLSFSDVIVLHDTYYPPCRDGILSALANHDVYADLEFVPGGLQSDGMWGGLGIVVPSLSRKQQLYTTQRQSIYGAMILPWLLHQSRAALDRRRRRTLERIGRVMAHLLQ